VTIFDNDTMDISAATCALPPFDLIARPTLAKKIVHPPDEVPPDEVP
jgi:hypothetical protein